MENIKELQDILNRYYEELINAKDDKEVKAIMGSFKKVKFREGDTIKGGRRKEDKIEED